MLLYVYLGEKMLNRFLHEIYASDISTILITIPILLFVWSVIGTFLYKHMRIIGTIMVVIAAVSILYITVLDRGKTGAGAYFIPFSSFERAKIQPEMYRSMLMNVFLFIPLGLALPFILGGGTGKRILLTILVGLVLSVTVEAIQYFGNLGLTETDDVICNTLGTAIGSCSYLLSLLWKRVIQKRFDRIKGQNKHAWQTDKKN